VEAAYRSGVALRNASYDHGLRKARKAALPVVSIGNLTVGGTGKTPIAAWAASRLLALVARPAILLRGYGSDEVLLHRRWHPSIPVLPDPDRLRSARSAAEQGADVLVLDDGFQHRRIARDLDVVLVSAEQEFPGRHLPRGPFRESVASLERADLVIVTRRDAPDSDVDELRRAVERLVPAKPLAVVKLAAGGWLDLEGRPAQPPRGEVLAVTAVAEPLAFQTQIEEATRRPVTLLIFPDHHDFDADDAREIAEDAEGRTVVVTEKDAVKLVELKDLLPPAVRVLTLVVRPELGGEHLEEALERVARQTRLAAAPPAGGTTEHGDPAVSRAPSGRRA
jgi:tetraacyldisaccharide 4'-kinase